MNGKVGEDLIRLGEHGTSLSFHDLQTIYNELTGKQEELRTCIGPGYKISFENLSQLNHIIKQCLISYGAKIGNTAITLTNTKGQREVFSSFERFSIFNKGSPTATAGVTILYQFLIIPAGSQKPLQYKIEIDLPSPIGYQERAKSQDFGPFSMVMFSAGVHGHSKISYVDYSAARHFQAQIDDWVGTLEIEKRPKWAKFLQRYSHYFDRFAVFIFTTIILCSASLFIFNIELPADNIVRSEDIKKFNILLYATMIGILFSWFLGFFVGKFTEAAVDGIRSLSYINLNKGDEKLISKWCDRQKKAKRNFIGGLISTAVLALSINLLAAYIAEKWL